MTGISFKNPELLFLLLGLIPMLVWYIFKQHDIHAPIQLSSIQSLSKAPKTYKYYLRHILFACRIIAMGLLIVALARPQSSDDWVNENIEGIDIVIAADISLSMLARDLKPDRLEASKAVIKEFVESRPNDRMGLVVFAGESFTQCPLTTDHQVVSNLLMDVDPFMMQENGTAIGLGLATAVSRLKDSDAKSKVVILLTDGENNMGSIAPLTAAEIAQEFRVRVYTIGVGTTGQAPTPRFYPGTKRIADYQYAEVRIDEKSLKEIAQMTGGKYFRATNNGKLKEIYEEIDKLEKSKIDVVEYSDKHDEFLLLVLIASALIFVEMLLKYTLFRSLP